MDYIEIKCTLCDIDVEYLKHVLFFALNLTLCDMINLKECIVTRGRNTYMPTLL